MDDFAIDIPQLELEDLHARLANTRPPRVKEQGWEAGVDLNFLNELVQYWRNDYDWRATEARLNALPQHTATLNGSRIHFIHLRSSHPDAPAIILLHGWPYSFLEMLPLAEQLKEFHVVVPSLPGFGFSEAPPAQRWSPSVIGPLMVELMTEVLGYQRFFTYGEDVGEPVSEWMAAYHPEAVEGLFCTHAPFPHASRRENLSVEEQEFLAAMAERWQRGGGYAAEQSTKPTTLAAGLNDSPAGLLAWMVEKYHGWSGTEADFYADWSRDDILDCVSLYWFSQSIRTSFAPYFDGLEREKFPMITVPVGALIQHGERGFPRSYAERSCTDIRYWEYLAEGGHFTAKQRPREVASALRAFVAGL